jgi:hypothetical protein
MLALFVGGHPNHLPLTRTDFWAQVIVSLAIGWGVAGTTAAVRGAFDLERILKICIVTMAVAAYSMASGRYRATLAGDKPLICRTNPKAPGCFSQSRL